MDAYWVTWGPTIAPVCAFMFFAVPEACRTWLFTSTRITTSTTHTADADMAPIRVRVIGRRLKDDFCRDLDDGLR